jgi:hypothetical protein
MDVIDGYTFNSPNWNLFQPNNQSKTTGWNFNLGSDMSNLIPETIQQPKTIGPTIQSLYNGSDGFFGAGTVTGAGDAMKYTPSGWGKIAGAYNPLTKQQMTGFGGTAFDLLKGGVSAYGQYKKLGLAKDTLNFNKEVFAKNYDAQKQLTMADFAWREKFRKDYDPSYQKQSLNLM